ncbi:hypothetical protein CTZ27_35320 [Streptomyces griseocarneus]|nr:hypothetical protein CTZ27_35320 [Streptomyces griseocarneus]
MRLLAHRLARPITALTAALCLVSGPVSARAETTGLWRALARCESSENWHANTGNGYYGGLQFSPRTWKSFGGTLFAPRADLASPPQQITVARRVLHRQGWHAWPACHHRLHTAPCPRALTAPSSRRRPDGQHAGVTGRIHEARAHDPASRTGHRQGTSRSCLRRPRGYAGSHVPRSGRLASIHRSTKIRCLPRPPGRRQGCAHGTAAPPVPGYHGTWHVSKARGEGNRRDLSRSRSLSTKPAGLPRPHERVPEREDSP